MDTMPVVLRSFCKYTEGLCMKWTKCHCILNLKIGCLLNCWWQREGDTESGAQASPGVTSLPFSLLPPRLLLCLQPYNLPPGYCLPLNDTQVLNAYSLPRIKAFPPAFCLSSRLLAAFCSVSSLPTYLQLHFLKYADILEYITASVTNR